MRDNGATEVRGERSCAERLTEGLTVAVASFLSFGLLAGPAAVFGAAAWQLVTDTGTTVFSRLSALLVFLALVVLPLVLTRVVFRSGLRKGYERLTAAVPAALTLLGSSVVSFAALLLVVVYAD
ncbi:hypothetical protein ACFWOL_03685 [Streptomyces sp. NPDC058442]|uniref:hypothetical protein n=1 Tax=Streptomyces sp. NPDC058442 TaxID=3346503 RepID=UPI003647D70F